MIALIAAVHFTLGAIWHSVSPGIWIREERFAASGPLAPVRAIVVRIDPALHRFRLDLARSQSGLQSQWTVDSIPPDAVVALNVGQFIGGFPWGWLVRDGSNRSREAAELAARSPGAHRNAGSLIGPLMNTSSAQEAFSNTSILFLDYMSHARRSPQGMTDTPCWLGGSVYKSGARTASASAAC
jgi:hypothetical protein